MNNEQPYLEQTITTVVKAYNPAYGDDRICICGHAYYRHFDTYDGMSNIGCKYCFCTEFREADLSPANIKKMRDKVRKTYFPEAVEHFIDTDSQSALKNLLEYHFNTLQEK